MFYAPNTAYYKEFTTCNPTTMAAQNADSLPVATANHNGTDDATFSLTVAAIDTGRYKITGTVPAGYSAGDVVNVTIAATVASVAGKAIVDSFTVLASLPFAPPTPPTAAQNATAIFTDLTAGTDFQTTGSIGKLLAAIVNQTGDCYTRLGAPAGASVSADIAAVKSSVGTPMQTGNVTVGGYATHQDPLYLLTGAAVQMAINADGTIKADLRDINGTSIAGTGTQVAAAFLNAFNVAAPAFTMASVNQSGDGYAIVDNGTYGNSALHTAIGSPQQAGSPVTLPTTPPTGYATSTAVAGVLTAVNAITANTARSQPVVPSSFIRPASSSIAYTVLLNLYSLQGILEAPDAAPVIHCKTAGGSSRDDHLGSTTMTLLGTGQYSATYTVQSTDAEEALYFAFTWAISGTSMGDAAAVEVQDAVTNSALAAIQTQVNKLTFDGSNNVKSTPQTQVTLTSGEHTNIAADVQSGLTSQGYTASRAGFLDVLSGIVASIAVAVWSATTRTLSAFGFKPAVTLAAADVSGNLPVDLQTIQTQTVTCAAGVTISPYVGNATHVIVVDASGYVTFNNTTIATLTNAPPDSAGVTSLLGMTEVV